MSKTLTVINGGKNEKTANVVGKKLYAVVTCADEKGRLEYWDLADADTPNFVWAESEDEAKRIFAEWVGDGLKVEQVRVLGEVIDMKIGGGVTPGSGADYKVTIQKTLEIDMEQIINETEGFNDESL